MTTSATSTEETAAISSDGATAAPYAEYFAAAVNLMAGAAAVASALALTQ